MSDYDLSDSPPPRSQNVKRTQEITITNEREILRHWQIDSLQSLMPKDLTPTSFSPALIRLLVQIARLVEVDEARKQLESTIVERREIEDLSKKRIKKRNWLTPADCKEVLSELRFDNSTTEEPAATQEPATGSGPRATLSGTDRQTPSQRTPQRPQRPRTRRISTASSSSASIDAQQNTEAERRQVATPQQKAFPEQKPLMPVGKAITVSRASMSESSTSSSIPNTRTSPDLSYGSHPEHIAELLSTTSGPMLTTVTSGTLNTKSGILDSSSGIPNTKSGTSNTTTGIDDIPDTPGIPTSPLSPNFRQRMGQRSSSPQDPRKNTPQPRQNIVSLQTPQPSSSANDNGATTTISAPSGIMMRPPRGRTSSVPRDRTSSVPRDRASSVFHRISPSEDNIKRKWIELASEIEQEVVRLEAQVNAQKALLECIENERVEAELKYDNLGSQVDRLTGEYETIVAESARLQERLPDVTTQLEGILADLFPGEEISKGGTVDVETPAGAVTQTLATFRDAVGVKARACEKISRQLEIAKSNHGMMEKTLEAKEQELVELDDHVKKLEQDLEDLKMDASILKKRRHDQ
ncbi:hypothetical protein B0H67DRAFT_583350 [Lasiosphaeris hirsuta]|uniref:Uncharacterized protein n=1 Tax=Lasiosphaeris hirsuta TaxID=260670 RepID=A0AA40DP20_9PEZI|nr:hypothetical protein B0H67DRAFT_583350 [Lasiosphaeris hirsuta]